MDENTPVRYTVYCSLIKVAATCNAISFIPTDLDQVQQFKAHTHTHTQRCWLKLLLGEGARSTLMTRFYDAL